MIDAEDFTNRAALEQGYPIHDPKYGPALTLSLLNSQSKWVVGFRSLVYVSLVTGLLSLWWPRLALDLECGVFFGVANMMFLMWSNERFIEGRVSRSRRSLQTFMRLIVVGTMIAVMMNAGPWWAFLIAFTGFYTPNILYLFTLTKNS